MASSLAAALRATARAGSAARGLERRASCRAASVSGRSARSAGKEPSTVPAPAPPLRLYFSDWAEVRLPDKHRFPMDKYRATRLALEADMSLRGRVEILRSPEASLEDVLGVHDREYVSRVMRGALTDKEARAIGFPLQNPEQVTRSFASTGGAIAATRDVLTDALTDGDAPRCRVAAQIAGGTHHAFADKGEGFCVFNDIACAANVALAEFRDALFARSATPILVIDLDVHQGNGTAAIFRNDATVFTYSIHQENLYPVKQRSDLDRGLPDRVEDALYLEMLMEDLDSIDARFEPDLVWYLAGVDPHKDDQLGGLSLTADGLGRRDEMVLGRYSGRAIPVAVSLAGGYAPSPMETARLHMGTMRAAEALRD